MIEKLSNYKAQDFLSKKFIPTFLPFYNLDAPTIEFLANKMNIDNPIEFGTWITLTSQVGKHKEEVQALETFCEEVSEISNQCERFKRYLGSMFTEDLEEDAEKNNRKVQNTKGTEKKEYNPAVFLERIAKLDITFILVELLDKFIFYQKVTLVRIFSFFSVSHILIEIPTYTYYPKLSLLEKRVYAGKDLLYGLFKTRRRNPTPNSFIRVLG